MERITKNVAGIRRTRDRRNRLHPCRSKQYVWMTQVHSLDTLRSIALVRKEFLLRLKKLPEYKGELLRQYRQAIHWCVYGYGAGVSRFLAFSQAI